MRHKVFALASLVLGAISLLGSQAQAQSGFLESWDVYIPTLSYDVQGNHSTPGIVGNPGSHQPLTLNDEQKFLSTPGQFRVSESTGAAQYTVPLKVPPGRALTPTVVINYSSSASTDPDLGVGFSLGAGARVISRCRKTLASHGQVLPVQHDSTDALCLDGKLLVEVSSGVFHPENDRSIRVLARDVSPQGDLAQGPDSFVVQDGDGTHHHFGPWLTCSDVSIDSSDCNGGVPHKGVIVSWHLSRTTDAFGNYQTYEYGRSQPVTDGIVRPHLEKIRYNGFDGQQAGQSISPQREVVFEYQDLPSSGWVSGFFAGSKTLKKQYLKTIKMKVDGLEVQSYSFLFDADSLALGRPLLRELQECATSQGIKSCANPTRFEWSGDSVDPVAPKFSLTREEVLHDQGVSAYHLKRAGIPQMIDLNCDGRDDLLFRHESLSTGIFSWHVALGLSGPDGSPRFSPFFKDTGIGAFEYIIPTDHDRDGCTDFYVFEDPDIAIYGEGENAWVDETGYIQSYVDGDRRAEKDWMDDKIYVESATVPNPPPAGPESTLTLLRTNWNGNSTVSFDETFVMSLDQVDSSHLTTLFHSRFSLSPTLWTRGYRGTVLFYDMNDDGYEDILYYKLSNWALAPAGWVHKEGEWFARLGDPSSPTGFGPEINTGLTAAAHGTANAMVGVDYDTYYMAEFLSGFRTFVSTDGTQRSYPMFSYVVAPNGPHLVGLLPFEIASLIEGLHEFIDVWTGEPGISLNFVLKHDGQSFSIEPYTNTLQAEVDETLVCPNAFSQQLLGFDANADGLKDFLIAEVVNSTIYQGTPAARRNFQNFEKLCNAPSMTIAGQAVSTGTARIPLKVVYSTGDGRYEDSGLVWFDAYDLMPMYRGNEHSNGIVAEQVRQLFEEARLLDYDEDGHIDILVPRLSDVMFQDLVHTDPLFVLFDVFNEFLPNDWTGEGVYYNSRPVTFYEPGEWVVLLNRHDGSLGNHFVVQETGIPYRWNNHEELPISIGLRHSKAASVSSQTLIVTPDESHRPSLMFVETARNHSDPQEAMEYKYFVHEYLPQRGQRLVAIREGTLGVPEADLSDPSQPHHDLENTATVFIEYTDLDDALVHVHPQNQPPPANRLWSLGKRTIVKSYVVDNGPHHEAHEVKMTYYNGTHSRWGHGFLGFEKTKRERIYPSSGGSARPEVSVETEYDQIGYVVADKRFPTAMAPHKVTHRKFDPVSGETETTVALSQYEYTPTGDGLFDLREVQKVTETTREFPGNLSHKVTRSQVDMEYDLYGNVVLSTTRVDGATNDPGDDAQLTKTVHVMEPPIILPAAQTLTSSGVTPGSYWLRWRQQTQTCQYRSGSSSPENCVDAVVLTRNAQGLPTQIQKPFPGDPSLDVAVAFDYDIYGRKISGATDGMSQGALRTIQDTRVVYGSTGRDIWPSLTVNALGHVQEFFYDGVWGLVTSQTALQDGSSLELLTSYFEYDQFGRQIRSIDPRGAQTLTVHTTTTDARGHKHAVQHVMRSDGSSVATIFNRLGAPSKTLRRMSPTKISEVRYAYDDHGREARVSRPFYEDQSGAQPHYTAKFYDIFERLDKVELPDGLSSQTTIGCVHPVDGQCLDHRVVETIEDPSGNRSYKVRSGDGRMLEAIDADGNVTSFKYHSRGSLERTSVTGGYVQEMTYDALGRPETSQDSDRPLTQTIYDAFGRVERVETPGTSPVEYVAYTYDDLNRVISEERPDGTHEYWYDSAFPGSQDVVGHADGMTTVVHYDAFRQPERTTHTIDGVDYDVVTERDGFGRLQRMIYPMSPELKKAPSHFSEFSLMYEYTPVGLLQGIVREDTGEVLMDVLRRDDQGRVVEVLTGNGQITTRLINETTDLLDVLHAADQQSGDVLQEMSFEYDKNGNLLARHDALRSLREEFQYDALDRLVNVRCVGGHCQNVALSYDSLGRILSRSQVGQYIEYGDGNSTQLNAVRTIEHDDGIFSHFDYDAHGRQIARHTPRGDYEIVYDSFGKPRSYLSGTWSFPGMDFMSRSFAPDGGQVDMRYFAGGDLAVREIHTQGGQRSKIVYAGGLERREDLDTGEVEDTIRVGLGGISFELVRKNTSATEEARYIHKDFLGSTDVVTDGSGNVRQARSFDAFGVERDSQYWGQIPGNFTPITPRGYTGHEDLNLLGMGLIDMGGRVYDPHVGRMLSPDIYIQNPEFSQAYSAYTYTINNPLKYTDPTGWQWDLGIRWQAYPDQANMQCDGFTCVPSSQDNGWGWSPFSFLSSITGYFRDHPSTPNPIKAWLGHQQAMAMFQNRLFEIESQMPRDYFEDAKQGRISYDQAAEATAMQIGRDMIPVAPAAYDTVQHEEAYAISLILGQYKKAAIHGTLATANSLFLVMDVVLLSGGLTTAPAQGATRASRMALNQAAGSSVRALSSSGSGKVFFDFSTPKATTSTSSSSRLFYNNSPDTFASEKRTAILAGVEAKDATVEVVKSLFREGRELIWAISEGGVLRVSLQQKFGRGGVQFINHPTLVGGGPVQAAGTISGFSGGRLGRGASLGYLDTHSGHYMRNLPPNFRITEEEAKAALELGKSAFLRIGFESIGHSRIYKGP